MTIKTILLTLAAGTSFAAQPNAVILGNATTYGGDSDAGVYVQGNWSGTNYEPNNHNLSSPGLYLGGDNLTTNFLRVNQGVGTIVGAKGNYQGVLTNSAPPNWAYYDGLSESYGSFTGNSVDLSAPNNIKLTINSGLNVFNVSSSQLTGLKTMDFTGSGTVIFNVTGNLNSWGISVNYDASKILWNFVDATYINIDQRQFTGTLLADEATVEMRQNLTGLLVAKEWTNFGSSELHAANLPIPEPSVALLAALGLVLGFSRKR